MTTSKMIKATVEELLTVDDADLGWEATEIALLRDERGYNHKGSGHGPREEAAVCVELARTHREMENGRTRIRPSDDFATRGDGHWRLIRRHPVKREG